MKFPSRGYVFAVALSLIVLFAGIDAQAQVLEQVPSTALAVFKVKNLDAVNAKVVKMAKAFGLDQMSPDFADPLGALTQKLHIKQGLNKAGDMAFVIFDQAPGRKPGQNMMVLVPVSDYQAFLGNLKDAQETDGVAHATAPNTNEDLYVAHWGEYAAVAQDKSLVASKPADTFKPTGLAVKESDTKDMVLMANMDQIRKVALPKLQKERHKILVEASKEVGKDEATKKFVPVVRTIVNIALDGVESFLTDSTSSVVSFNLADDGIATTALAEFRPDSSWGKNALELKGEGSGGSLLTGLPDRKYYAFGGYAADPAVTGRIAAMIFDPIVKELGDTGDIGKQIGDTLQAMVTTIGAIDRSTAGYVVATGALGQESIIQTVAVAHGNAKAIKEGELSIFKGMSSLMAVVPQDKNPTKMGFEVTPDAKTVDGVSLDSFQVTTNADPNDPKAAQAQQMMKMMYGPNGVSGVMGAVDAKTFVLVECGTDKLISEAIAAAKNPQDQLSTLPGVKMVSAHLPEKRVMEYYVQMDQIVSSAVRYAAGFGFPVKLRLPPNLPPIGVSAATDGPAYRIDSFVPSTLIESLVAAGIEAYTNMQGGPGGAGGPGGL